MVDGKYCEVKNKNKPSNTMNPRKNEAIDLLLTDNFNGIDKLFALRLAVSSTVASGMSNSCYSG